MELKEAFKRLSKMDYDISYSSKDMYWVLNIYTPGNRKEYKGKYLKGILELLFDTTLDFNLADEVTVAVKKYRAKLDLKFSNVKGGENYFKTDYKTKVKSLKDLAKTLERFNSDYLDYYSMS